MKKLLPGAFACLWIVALDTVSAGTLYFFGGHPDNKWNTAGNWFVPDPAIVRTLAPGNYTAIVKGKNDATGVALVELYNLP